MSDHKNEETLEFNKKINHEETTNNTELLEHAKDNDKNESKDPDLVLGCGELYNHNETKGHDDANNIGRDKSEELSITDNIIEGMLNEEEESKICESLKLQVKAELDEISSASEEKLHEKKKSKSIKRILMVAGIILSVMLICVALVLGTKAGRRIIYRAAGNYIYDKTDKENHTSVSANTDIEPPIQEEVDKNPVIQPEEPEDVIMTPRQEEYVTNFLIFGVEEIQNAKNTDTIMLVSINCKDFTIKLTSILRDTYIERADQVPSKLNAIYASEGVDGLIGQLEQNFLIKIDGYAYINFEAFEAVINYLGGISLELGKEEAHYLNTTNYISEKEYRNVKEGWNTLNGNQALGYCRVRRCVTLGGANDDYGRTLRQRRVMSAIFNRYKSKNIFELLKITDNCLGHVRTNLTRNQIEKALEDVIENRITSMNTLRVPVNNGFETPGEWNGIVDPLVLDWETNILELYQFIFLDTEEEAQIALDISSAGKFKE